MSRIGTYVREDAKVRPLKITVETEEEQQKVMENLKNLKGKQDYKGISIKEDYTISERQPIREYVEQAKALMILRKLKVNHSVQSERDTKKRAVCQEVYHTERKQHRPKISKN